MQTQDPKRQLISREQGLIDVSFKGGMQSFSVSYDESRSGRDMLPV